MSKTHKFKGVLFDLDGTLLDTANDLGAALNYVLAKYNKPLVAEKDYRPFTSDGSTGLLNLGFKEEITQYDFESLRTLFLDFYEQNIAHKTLLYSGVESLIHYLDTQHIPWGIVTNKPIGLTNLLLPHFPVLANCKSVLGGDSLPQRKPHPAPLLYASKEIGIEPENCVYIGDAPRDIESGNAAGMCTIIAQWGYINDLSDCINWHADHMLETPKDIITFLQT